MNDWKRGHPERTDAEQRERDKLTLMRQAKTNTTTNYGMGGLPNGKGHRPKSISLAPVNIPDQE